MQKINWTEITNLAGQMHNLAQDPYMPADDQRDHDMILKILDLLGLDTDKIIEICDEIDGCCFEIAQNKEITREHLEQENNAIDQCSTTLRALVENLGKGE